MLISAKEIINKSIDLYKNNWELFLKYMLWLFIPTGIIAITSTILGTFFVAVNTYGFGIPVIIYILIFLIASIINIWISLTFTRVLAVKYERGNNKDIKQELYEGVPLIIPAILISILVGLIVLGGIILFIIPGIIFSIWLAFAFYAVVIDKNKPSIALGKSKELVKGRWWKVLWKLLAPAIIFNLVLLLVQWIITLPLDTILQNLTKNTPTFTFLLTLFTLISTAIGLLFVPLTAAAPVILYLELKKHPNKNISDKPTE